MPPKSRAEQPLPIAITGIGEAHPQELDTRTELERSIQSNVSALEVLSLFSAMNQRKHLLANPDSLDRYGSGKFEVRKNIRNQLDELRQKAKDVFYKSMDYDSGLQQVETLGMPTDKFQRAASRKWDTFKKQYDAATPQALASRRTLAKQLRAEIKDMRTQGNRAIPLRPHLLDEFRAKQGLPKLSSRERMQAIKEDPRAMFAPATNREKTMIFTWLDYLDNPDYPLGVTNQMLEVYNHNARLYKENKDKYAKDLPEQAMRSLSYEVHDYRENASLSLRLLRQLENEVSQLVNPNVSIQEDAPNHPGIRPLIRYRDGQQFIADDVQPELVRHDVLLTKEDRQPHVVADKNKSVEDQYTRREMDIYPKIHIEISAGQLTVGEARGLLREAVANEERRYAFWDERLAELSEAPDSRYNVIRQTAGRLLLHHGRILPKIVRV